MISSLTLRNFGPFRGEHRLDLAPATYAVVARREDDPEASNFSGKSWFLSAVRFALFGSHLADREDSWITRGEREGGVVLTLSDGMSVERSRTVGKSTVLEVKTPAGSGRGPLSTATKALQRDAQQLVERRVGLGEADFLAAAFFAQKAMSRFVVARPSARSEEVSAWLRLDRLQRAHRRAVSMAGEVERAEQLAAAREASLRERLYALTHPKPGSVRVGPVCTGGVECGLAGCAGCSLVPDPLVHSRAVVEVLAAKVRAASLDVQRADKEHRTAHLLLGQAQAVRHREQLRAEIAELEAQGGEEPDLKGPRGRHEEASQAKREAFREVAEKRRLAAGGFSGTCPVNGGACPIADDLNADRERSARLAREAESAFHERMAEALAAGVDLDRAQGALDALRTRRTRLDTLRGQLAHVDASSPVLEPGVAIPYPDEIRQLELHARNLRDLERSAALDLDRAERAADEMSDLTAELDHVREDRLALAAQLRTRREAAAVLGRGGVQRRVAEGALREVQEGANALLSEAGVDLDVRLLWDRPTDQPAAVCDACDAPYPPSRRVKECARCGAPRGPKLAEGLDVELSKVSGFAEDAAGIALSLAAGAWLRRERDVQWPVLCADEAWASADVKNRRALLNLFKVAGRMCGISQMFLVAHSDALMDTLPGRIEVVAGPNGSRVSVVA